MAVMTLILADSGYGKTYSIRNVNPENAILARCIRKALPFRNNGWKLHGKRLPDNSIQRGNVVDIRNGRHLLDVIRNAAMSGRKILIIDDFQAVMQHENMDRAYETGYTKFTEMAEHAWRIIEAATQLPDDFRVYFLAHTEDSEGKIRMKTVGKMLNEKLTPEGYFPIVLRIIKRDGKHLFLLKGDDNDTVKCPPDLFGPEVTDMDNDLAAFDNAISEFTDL
ncbi:ATP-binding protein [Enterobacter cloacae complex sp. IR5378]|uniref:ATP-binding protein n=1 Tax=unclassified Enterobacter cloacae complex TaxID=2757714 RepID=UPI003B9952A9